MYIWQCIFLESRGKCQAQPGSGRKSQWTVYWERHRHDWEYYFHGLCHKKMLLRFEELGGPSSGFSVIDRRGGLGRARSCVLVVFKDLEVWEGNWDRTASQFGFEFDVRVGSKFLSQTISMISAPGTRPQILRRSSMGRSMNLWKGVRVFGCSRKLPVWFDFVRVPCWWVPSWHERQLRVVGDVWIVMKQKALLLQSYL